MTMRFLKLFALNLIVYFTVVSCATVKTSEVVNLGFDTNKGSITGGDFIELNDGKIIRGTIDKYKLQLGLINKNKGTVTINNTEYHSNDIIAFQKESDYFKKLKGTTYFMQRKKAGKINLYYRHFSAQTRSVTTGNFTKMVTDPAYDLHWLQKGLDGEIQKYSLKLLESMVLDNAESVNLIDAYKQAKNKNKKDSDLDKAIDIYNKS
jgi:hypothetical protein